MEAGLNLAVLVRNNHPLARRLGIEFPIGLLGLVQGPAVGEEGFDVDVVVGDEFGAVGLALGREGSGADQGDLAAQHVGADIDHHVAALAHIAGRAPGADRLDRRLTGRGGR